MDNMAGDTTKVPALGISFRTLLDREGRREIVFQTHVDQEISTFVLNKMLDRLSLATDRQIARAELAETKRQLEHEEKQVEIFESALAQLDIASQTRWESSERKGPWDPSKLPPTERQDRANTKLGVERSRGAVVALRKKVAELEVIVNGDAPASSADSDARVSDR